MQPWKLIQDTARLDAPLDDGGKLIKDSGFASSAHPKLKFNFTVDFSFRSSVVGTGKMELLDLPVKTASRPQQSFALTEVNFYNYRTKVATRTENGTGTIVMYDDAEGRAHGIYTKYMNLINPISNIGNNREVIKNPLGTPFGQLSSLGPMPENPNGIFDTISVYHFYVDKGRVYRTEYRYINPQVEQFELDELSMSESDVNTISLTFSYSGVVTTTTEV